MPTNPYGDAYSDLVKEYGAIREEEQSATTSPLLTKDGREAILGNFSRDLFGLFPEAKMCFEEPYLAHRSDPIYGIRTKPGYIFDDAFWELFREYPFLICHVTWLPEEEVLEMRFGLDKVEQ